MDETPLQHLMRERAAEGQSKLRARLAGFGLGPDQADTEVGRLSGGQKARLSLLLATLPAPHLLILDEPTNHLDIRHQLEVLDLIRSLPLTIVASLHDLNLAAGVCDDVLLIHAGHSVGFGPPSQVLSETAVSDAFQITARREQLSHAGTEHLTYHLHHKGPHP